MNYETYLHVYQSARNAHRGLDDSVRQSMEQGSGVRKSGQSEYIEERPDVHIRHMFISESEIPHKIQGMVFHRVYFQDVIPSSRLEEVKSWLKSNQSHS